MKRTVTLPLVVVWLVVALAWLAPALPAAAGPLEVGQRSLRAGQYETALAQAAKGQATKGQPRGASHGVSDPQRAVLASRALLALGRYDEARRTLEAATASAPEDLPARDALMRLYSLVG